MSTLKTTRLAPARRARADRLLARVRHRQLELAQRGRYRESARYARLARGIHRLLDGQVRRAAGR